VTVVPAMAAMHEQVNDWTQEQEHVGKRAEQMCPVFLPQEERGYRQEYAESQPVRNSPGLAMRVSFNGGRHDRLRMKRCSTEPMFDAAWD
jgi:hypothetical protein